MKLALFVVIGILLTQTICSQNENSIDWNSDLDYLANELAEKHCNLFVIKSKEDFLSGIEAIKSESENLTDFQIALKAQQLIAACGDSHTMLSFTQMIDKNQILPMNVYWAGDGLYILHTSPENKDIVGSRLIAINEVPIEEVIESISTVLTVDNQAIIKLLTPQFLASLQILKHFGFAGSEPVELELQTPTNENLTYLLKPSEMNSNNRISIKPDSVAFCLKNQNVLFTDSYYPDEKIYYILYNRCMSKEIALKHGNKEQAEKLPSFNEFEEKVFSVLQNNPVDKIIFDIRHNGGGDSSQGTAFIKKLSEFLETNPDVQTYAIIGRSTFSSAIINAMDFKHLTNAVFVGEETRGKLNHFGEVRNFQLPHSKLNVSYSTKYFQLVEEDSHTLIPDAKIEMSFSDLMKGIDPVFEWIKEQ